MEGDEEHRSEKQWLKSKHQDEIGKLRDTHQKEIDRHKKHYGEVEKRLEEAGKEVKRLKGELGLVDQLREELKLARVEVVTTKATIKSLKLFQANVLDVWDTAEDPGSFTQAACEHCQNLVDAEAMPPILPQDYGKEEDAKRRAAQAKAKKIASKGKNQFLKNTIRRVIVGQRTERQQQDSGHVSLDNVVDEVVVNQESVDQIAHVHATIRLAKEHRVLMKNLTARKKELELLATKLQIEKEKSQGVSNTVSRVFNKYKAKKSVGKMRDLEQKIRDNSSTLAETKAAMRAAKFHSDVTALLRDKYKGDLLKKDEEIASLAKKVREQKRRGNEQEVTIESLKRQVVFLEHLSEKTEKVVKGGVVQKLSSKKPPSRRQHGQQRGNGGQTSQAAATPSPARGNRYVVHPGGPETMPAARPPFVDPAAPGQKEGPSDVEYPMALGPDEGGYEQKVVEYDGSFVAAGTGRGVEDVLDDNQEGAHTPKPGPRQTITRWVLPISSPEEKDNISTAFGGIPWNRLPLCCKNSLLEFGRGNQRGLGHQMVGPVGPSPSKDPSEMGKNLLSRGVL